MTPAPLLPVRVCPERLAYGTWCHARNRQVGQGDIRASYSADLIGLEGRIRKPFRLQGRLCVMTGSSGTRDACAFTAYRLVLPREFDGTVTTYRDKLLIGGGDYARADPQGFYHGMRVTRGRETFVLCGPPVTILAGEPAPRQGDLFD